MNEFDIDDIRRLATAASFARGEQYYEDGEVMKITKTGNHFEGTVRGTSNYKVSMDISGHELDFWCSCPYDYGGICKHSVAFGLAVLDGDFAEKTDSISSKPEMGLDEFRDFYREADTRKKHLFLKQILEKDSGLQMQFVAFVKGKTEKLDDIAGIKIDEIKNEVYEELSSIDFDDVVEKYNPYKNGYYDDDSYADEAYEAIAEVFQPYASNAVDFINKGNLLDGIRIMLGMYEGSQNLPEPDDSNYELFCDTYDDEAYGELKIKFTKITNAICKTVFADETIKQAVDLVFERYGHYKGNLNKNEDDCNIFYELGTFKELLIALVANKTTAAYLHDKISGNSLTTISTAYVLLKIAEILEDNGLWTETAEKYAKNEENISRQLLEKYRLKKDWDNFVRVAHTAFANWPDQFDLYLIENLNTDLDKKLYIKALSHFAKNKQSLGHYKTLRKYFTDNQRKAFVDEIGKSSDSIFYVQLLETEKRYADILQFVANRNYYEKLENLIWPIINIYPKECFGLIKEECEHSMNSHKRNRRTYQHIARCLQWMEQIKEMQVDARQYIMSLYNHKPNLPALKDELRMHLNMKFV